MTRWQNVKKQNVQTFLRKGNPIHVPDNMIFRKTEKLPVCPHMNLNIDFIFT